MRTAKLDQFVRQKDLTRGPRRYPAARSSKYGTASERTRRDRGRKTAMSSASLRSLPAAGACFASWRTTAGTRAFISTTIFNSARPNHRCRETPGSLLVLQSLLGCLEERVAPAELVQRDAGSGQPGSNRLDCGSLGR
jgi:hypothetical protein